MSSLAPGLRQWRDTNIGDYSDMSVQQPSNIKPDLIAALLIMLAVVTVFAQVSGHTLIGYDDPYFILNQAYVTSGLSWENTQWAWRTVLMDIWHPLTWLSYQLESELFGATNDGARFLSNAFVHLCNALLVYVISRLFGFRVVNALIVALLFAVHPQHVEVVAWASERKELLATFFMLLSLWQYLLHLATGARRYYVLSLLLFVCALLSKASAAPLAVLLPVIELWVPRGGEDADPPGLPAARFNRRLFLIAAKSIPFLLAAAVVAGVTIHLQASVAAVQGDGLNSIVHYLLMMGVRFAWYLKMTFWPVPLSLFHEQPPSFSAMQLLQSAGLIMVFVGCVWRYRSNRLFLLGVAWFMLFLAPTSGLIPVETIYVADRYSYQAHIGLFIALLAIVEKSNMRAIVPLAQAVCGLAILLFGVLSWQHTALWKNSVTLFAYQNRLDPGSDGPLVHLGYAYSLNKRYDRARHYYQQAIDARPEGFYGYAYMGFLEEKLGRYARAQAWYQQALKIQNPYKYHHVVEVYEHLVWVSSTLQDHAQALHYLAAGLGYFPNSTYLQAAKAYYAEHYPDMSLPALPADSVGSFPGRIP